MKRMMGLALPLFLFYSQFAHAGELGPSSSETVRITVTKAVGVVVNKTDSAACINPGGYKVYSFLPDCVGAAPTTDIVVNAQESSGVIMLFVNAV